MCIRDSSQAELADKLGYLLPFGAEQKVALLAEPDASIRLDMLQAWVDELQGDA